MRTRDIKEGKFYSNGNRVRVVVDVDDTPEAYVRAAVTFYEAQDGPSSWRFDMPVSEFAKWAIMECSQYFKRADGPEKKTKSKHPDHPAYVPATVCDANGCPYTDVEEPNCHNCPDFAFIDDKWVKVTKDGDTV